MVNSKNEEDNIGAAWSLEKKRKVDEILQLRFDEETWSDLEYQELMRLEVDVLDIRPLFPDSVIRQVELAFIEKKDFRYRGFHSGRVLTVETEMCEDVFKGWFSSTEKETWYRGYWYKLLNPSTASFYFT